MDKWTATYERKKKNLQEMRVSTAVSTFLPCISVSIVKPLQVVKIS